MAKSRSPLVIIFITVFIDLVGFGIVIPVLPIYARRFDASETVIGLLLGVFSAMQFIFSPILGRLSDRVGRRPVLLFSLIGTSAGFVIMGLAGLGLGNALLLLFLGRIIDGISGANISTAQAYIADVTPPAKRASGMGLIGAAFGLGFIVGPALGGVLSRVSLSAPFFFAAGLAAANAVALYFLLPESLKPEHRDRSRRRASIAEVLRESGSWHLGVIMGTWFFATLAFSMLTAIYALFTLLRFNYDAAHVGYIFAFVGLVGAIIQGGLIGRLVKAFGDKALVIAGTAVTALSMFWLPLSDSLGNLLLATTGIAVGNSLSTPTLNAMASKSASALLQGRVLGVLQSVASLARIIGPVLGGFLLSRDVQAASSTYGKTPFWAGGVIMIIALILSVSLQSMNVQEGVPLEQSGGKGV
ncbi:MAG TPA: MFS transporter [Blastocatellia bacterium]|nr:MFS transporter [Blastocatellia bacterium]